MHFTFKMIQFCFVRPKLRNYFLSYRRHWSIRLLARAIGRSKVETVSHINEVGQKGKRDILLRWAFPVRPMRRSIEFRHRHQFETVEGVFTKANILLHVDETRSFLTHAVERV